MFSELSDFQLGMMHAGAMHRIASKNPEEAWLEVCRGLKRLAHAHDHGFYSLTKR